MSFERWILLTVLAASGCATLPPPRPARVVARTPPAALCSDPSLGEHSFCLDAPRTESLLRREDFEIASASVTQSGVSRPQVLTLEFPKDGLVLRAKWKASKINGDAMNNSPRRELAAYALQKLFLEPSEYVVPPTAGRCLPTGWYTERLPAASPTFQGADCVFGVLSYWLENISQTAVYDRTRLERDDAYRQSLADMNVLAYLIDHRDTRPANFAISTDPLHPRAFSIDNGLAFSGLRNPRAWFTRGWNELLVPVLPRRLVDRLARITRADLDRLAVVAQYQVTGGLLVEVEPEPATAPKRGVRRAASVIQLGLTTDEIDKVEARLKRLLADVNRGVVAVR